MSNCSRIAMRASARRVTPENNRVIKACDEVDRPTNQPVVFRPMQCIIECIEVAAVPCSMKSNAIGIQCRQAVAQEKTRHLNVTCPSIELIVVRTITCPSQYLTDTQLHNISGWLPPKLW